MIILVVLVMATVVIVCTVGMLENKLHWFVVFINFHGINTLTMVYFKLPMQYQ